MCGRSRRSGLRASAFQEAAAGAPKFYAFIQTTTCCFSVRIFITFLIFRPSREIGLTRRPLLHSRPQITHTKVTFARPGRKKAGTPLRGPGPWPKMLLLIARGGAYSCSALSARRLTWLRPAVKPIRPRPTTLTPVATQRTTSSFCGPSPHTLPCMAPFMTWLLAVV